MKKLYAEVVLNKDELEESSCNRIELEYYKISRKERNNSKANLYGVEVVKKEYDQTRKLKEKIKFHSLTNDESRINNLLHILRRNKVTPIALNDVIEEVL